MTVRATIGLLVFVVGSAAHAAPASPEALALAQKVQHFYENTTDFTASFNQTYHYTAMSRTQKSSGTVEVKKPGFMRWDYTKPYPKAFVLDGKVLYAFDPDDNSVMVNRHFSSDTLSAAVTFLWGRGKLADEFELSVVDRKDYGAKVLELNPKKPQAGFTKVFFVVDAATGTVTTSVIFDAEGNENRIDFADVKVNQNLPESRFQFAIPKGAQVKEL